MYYPQNEIQAPLTRLLSSAQPRSVYTNNEIGAAATGALVGVPASVGLVSAAGTVTGLSAAGITSGLTALGGSMVGGIAVAAAVPLAAAGGAYLLWKALE